MYSILDDEVCTLYMSDYTLYIEYKVSAVYKLHGMKYNVHNYTNCAWNTKYVTFYNEHDIHCTWNTKYVKDYPQRMRL